ncbi:MAG: 4Fe-4S binding protein [Deltaproteobacteria bacterium]|nr:4Fe-4S binding protein [Deltaproteobacteria bacterium]
MLRIVIDRKKCTTPLECRKCLEQCQSGVFLTHPRKRRSLTTKATDWIITPVFISECTQCMACESFCPTQAITIKV